MIFDNENPTEQQVFDRCAQHLFIQGRPAIVDRKCRYRAPNGCKCAVGVFIPDDAYDPMMDSGYHGQEFKTLMKNFEHVLPPWFRKHAALLDSLQTAHDRCCTKPDGGFNLMSLRGRLATVARTFNLKTGVLAIAFEDAEIKEADYAGV